MNKISAERNQRVLLELAGLPGNDACADCKSRNPRWASHSIGIFICMHCASIHRKMGTHISKVKSLTMDTWSREQVEHMKNTGNIKSNSYYIPDEKRFPPPTNMVDSERDSELEKFIRAKYEYKSFINRGAAAAALLGPSKSASRLTSSPQPRSQTAPIPTTAPSTSVPPPLPPKQDSSPALPSPAVPSSAPAQPPLQSTLLSAQFRPASQPVASSPPPFTPQPSFSPGLQTQATGQYGAQQSQWAALASLQASSTSVQPSFAQFQTQQTGTALFASAQTNPYSGLSASPSSPFPSAQSSSAMNFNQGGAPRSVSLGTGLALNVNVGSAMGSNLTPGGASPYQMQASSGMSSPFHASSSPIQPSAASPFQSQPSVSPFQSTSFQSPHSALPFQSQASPFQQQPNLALGLSSPNMNPYAGLSANPMGGGAFASQPTGAFQPQSSPFMQVGQQQQQPSPLFPQQQLVQTPMQTNPNLNPFFQAQPQGFAPSPHGQQQQQQPMYGAGNPFNNYQAQQQSTGFAGQPWTGM
ncbi:hypothetical protein C8Q72DRAFT_828440 [Fomitopsis betulina]|nr:hypothetical protein C8Q72DRAFT_828440 [Fomitopsis betulina]